MRTTWLSDGATGTALTYGYNSLSQPSQISYGSGDVRTFGYDSLHRLKTDALKTSGGAAVASMTYGYDNNDNLTSKTTAGVSGASTNSYTCDFADGLATWTRVVHAPMWDSGDGQPPYLWSAAVLFAAEILSDDPTARVLIPCHQGRSRSVMVTYAVLRLRGHSPAEATQLICHHHVEARIVDAYVTSVKQWIAAGANSVGPLRMW